MKQDLQRRGGGLVVVVILIALVVVGIAIFMQSGLGPDGLQSHIDDYKAMLDNSGPGSEDATDVTPTGPVVVVDYDKSTLDDLFDRLPARLRAENHSSVQTVVVITRHSTGMPAAAAGAVAPVANVKGSYAIAAYLFTPDGRQIDAHSVRKESVMTGGGAEGELRAKADPEMVDWLIERLGG